MNEPNRPKTPPNNQQIQYWMGQVDFRLSNLESENANTNAKIDAGLAQVEARMLAALTQMEVRLVEKLTAGDEQAITWRWLADRFGGPVVTGVIVAMIVFFITRGGS